MYSTRLLIKQNSKKYELCKCISTQGLAGCDITVAPRINGDMQPWEDFTAGAPEFDDRFYRDYTSKNGRFLWKNGERGKMVENGGSEKNGVFRRVYRVNQVPYGVFTYIFHKNLFFVPVK